MVDLAREILLMSEQMCADETEVAFEFRSSVLKRVKTFKGFHWRLEYFYGSVIFDANTPVQILARMFYHHFMSMCVGIHDTQYLYIGNSSIAVWMMRPKEVAHSQIAFLEEVLQYPPILEKYGIMNEVD